MRPAHLHHHSDWLVGIELLSTLESRQKAYRDWSLLHTVVEDDRRGYGGHWGPTTVVERNPEHVEEKYRLYMVARLLYLLKRDNMFINGLYTKK